MSAVPQAPGQAPPVGDGLEPEPARDQALPDAARRTPHAAEAADILERAQSNAETGLSEEEAARRLATSGPNRIEEGAARSLLVIAAAQFRSLLVWLLIVAAAASLALGDWLEAAAIAVVVLVNAAIGFATEWRAVRSMEALRRMADHTTRVRREGHWRILPAADLVPGDVVLLEAGDVVTADLRLIKVSNLEADESALTGESAPIAKLSAALPAETVLPERANMAFKGTAVTHGQGLGLVIATGMRTELGRIAALAQSAEGIQSPLERRLDRLSRQLLWITLVLAGTILALGIFSGKDIVLMVKTGVALAVAAVPEGLPIVATMALARSLLRMARRNVLIDRLSAVETLGATTVIFTDKTGTLTENRMSVAFLALAGGDVPVQRRESAFAALDFTAEPGQPLGQAALLRAALEMGGLCNNASAEGSGSHRTGLGDPIECALLEAAEAGGIDMDAHRRQWPRVREDSFSATTKAMATWHEDARHRGAGYLVAVKGAPEPLIAWSTRIAGEAGPEPMTEQRRRFWLDRADAFARQGLRVLALARRSARDLADDPYHDLELVGLVAFVDPPRADVRAALDDCRSAGVRVIMVTGDHPETARTIAQEIGLGTRAEPSVCAGHHLDGVARGEPHAPALLEADVFGRVTPEQKLSLVDLYQNRGQVVAMTGDGVNDAPALKKADIGVAMGRRGTQVAREAADMVLEDDAFASIVLAMREGRIIFGNIRKMVVYLLSCNVSEILVVGAAAASGLPLPLMPLQILFLNLVTDVLPAFALGAGEGDKGVMNRPPRPPSEDILTRANWRTIGAYGAVLTIAVLGAFLYALEGLGRPVETAVTIAFLTLALGQIVHVFNMRDPDAGLLANDITRNPWIWGAVAGCLAILGAALFIDPLPEVLDLAPLSAADWQLVAAASLMPLAAGTAVHAVRGLMGR